MIVRRTERHVIAARKRQAAVALVGPRQVGKTTLAQDIALERAALYLDLENPGRPDKIVEPGAFSEPV